MKGSVVDSRGIMKGSVVVIGSTIMLGIMEHNRELQPLWLA